jgi:predicted metalloprotease with PDZ domain
VLGTEPLPYQRLLAAVGYAMRDRDTPGTLGTVSLQARQGRMVVANNTISTTPVYAAGLGKGDAVLSLNGAALTQDGDWERVLSTLTPGTEVELVFESRGERKAARVVVAKSDRIDVVPSPGPTPQQQALRGDWLGTRAK